MKKIFVFFILLFAFQPVFAVTNVGYNDFFTYEPISNTFSMVITDKKHIDYSDKEYYKNYKIAKKINRLYLKNKNSKILKKYPDFIPSLLEMYQYNYDNRNYNAALENLNTIKSLNKFNHEYLSLSFYKTYTALGKHEQALRELLPFKDKKDYYFFIADSYLNLNRYNEALNYASKVTSKDKRYYVAQEVIFKAYYRQKNYDKAKVVAKNLIKLEPLISDNYIRYAVCEINKNEKLKYLYLARNKEQSLTKKIQINGSIIKLEQEKVDFAYKKLKVFVEKPDWLTVYSSCDFGNDEYWMSRQDDFFKTANLCITQYVGLEQAKCFAHLNENQVKLNNILKEIDKEQREEEYKNAVLQQNELLIQQQMIRNINQVNTNNQLRDINFNLQQQNFQLQNINNRLRW